MSWLAHGRCAEYVYIGFVFLFYYGLDRTLSLEAAGARLLDVEGAWRALERVAAGLDSTSSVSSEHS